MSEIDFELTLRNNPHLSREELIRALTGREDSQRFRQAYALAHGRCPACGAIPHTTTLVSYPLVEGREDAYKDLNTCTCACGSVHTTHERLPF
jgi:hypothetical protein